MWLKLLTNLTYFITFQACSICGQSWRNAQWWQRGSYYIFGHLACQPGFAGWSLSIECMQKRPKTHSIKQWITWRRIKLNCGFSQKVSNNFYGILPFDGMMPQWTFLSKTGITKFQAHDEILDKFMNLKRVLSEWPSNQKFQSYRSCTVHTLHS